LSDLTLESGFIDEDVDAAHASEVWQAISLVRLEIAWITTVEILLNIYLFFVTAVLPSARVLVVSKTATRALALLPTTCNSIPTTTRQTWRLFILTTAGVLFTRCKTFLRFTIVPTAAAQVLGGGCWYIPNKIAKHWFDRMWKHGGGSKEVRYRVRSFCGCKKYNGVDQDEGHFLKLL
jgi:hypothetical protein